MLVYGLHLQPMLTEYVGELVLLHVAEKYAVMLRMSGNHRMVTRVLTYIKIRVTSLF